MRPPNVTLRQLAALDAVAQAGSLRRAADLSGQSQAALSAQVAALEAALSLRLFERRSTGLLPTVEGREVLAIARRALDAAGEVDALARRGGAPGPVTVLLGVSGSIGPYLLPAATRVLRDAAPGLSLDIREGPPGVLLEELLAGTHDAVLTQLPLPGESLSHEILLDEALFVLMAADDPLAAQERLQTSDLAGRRVLTLGPQFTLTPQVESLCRETGAVAVSRYRGMSLDALRVMAALGGDLAVVPEFYVRSEVRPGGGVAIRPLAGRRLVRRIALAWRRSQGRPVWVAPLGGAIAEGAAGLRALPVPPGDADTRGAEPGRADQGRGAPPAAG